MAIEIEYLSTKVKYFIGIWKILKVRVITEIILKFNSYLLSQIPFCSSFNWHPLLHNWREFQLFSAKLKSCCNALLTTFSCIQ